MYDELLSSIDAPNAGQFARDVIERFTNPYLAHSLFDITLHGTMKMRVRVVPAIVALAEKEKRVPELIAFGFAAWLLFLRGDLQRQRLNAGLPVPADENGAAIREMWSRGMSPDEIVHAVCSDESLWGVDLCAISGFGTAVSGHLTRMAEAGVRGSLSELLFRTHSSKELVAK
jgi:tagaturonate reductase